MLGEVSLIWKLHLPANIQFFLWQVSHDALPTRSVLQARGIIPQALCPCCEVEVESAWHCLFGCVHACDGYLEEVRGSPSYYQLTLCLSFCISLFVSQWTCMASLFLWCCGWSGDRGIGGSLRRLGFPLAL